MLLCLFLPFRGQCRYRRFRPAALASVVRGQMLDSSLQQPAAVGNAAAKGCGCPQGSFVRSGANTIRADKTPSFFARLLSLSPLIACVCGSFRTAVKGEFCPFRGASSPRQKPIAHSPQPTAPSPHACLRSHPRQRVERSGFAAFPLARRRLRKRRLRPSISGRTRAPPATSLHAFIRSVPQQGSTTVFSPRWFSRCRCGWLKIWVDREPSCAWRE